MAHHQLLLTGPAPSRFEMNGSHGMVEFDERGRVLEVNGCDCRGCDGRGYSDVAEVDVAELRQFYTDHWTLDEFYNCHFDVLEVSWWQKDGTYVPAEADYRLDMLNRRRDGHGI